MSCCDWTLLSASGAQLIGRSAASPSAATSATSFDNTSNSPLPYVNSPRSGTTMMNTPSPRSLVLHGQMQYSQSLGHQQFQGRQLPPGHVQHGIGQSQLNQGNQLSRQLSQFSSPANTALFNAAQATPRPSTQMIPNMSATYYVITVTSTTDAVFNMGSSASELIVSQIDSGQLTHSPGFVDRIRGHGSCLGQPLESMHFPNIILTFSLPNPKIKEPWIPWREDERIRRKSPPKAIPAAQQSSDVEPSQPETKNDTVGESKDIEVEESVSVDDFDLLDKFSSTTTKRQVLRESSSKSLWSGMELYPRIGKNFDIKVFTNCRFGMMSWAVLAESYCIKQYELYGKVADSMLVNTILMLVYVTKFFWWEAGYWNTMDIAHDRAGFYIYWGCLVWVPSVHTSPGMYLVNHPVNLGTQLALYILVAGILCIYINYDCDRQRQEFRRTNGKCKVWGKAPSKIEATYTTSGETKTNLLLTSGWRGLSRHFHFVPEILAAFFWTVPALFNHKLKWMKTNYLSLLKHLARKDSMHVHSEDSHGEVLRGDRIGNSPLCFKMREPKMCAVVCQIKLDAETVRRYLTTFLLLLYKRRLDQESTTVYQLGYHIGSNANIAG
ncbi:Ergosterol biosynthesis ERG4/ERG24 [Corchorus olitorius]|uniref:7-dehydrocholesterol reductase n=1 Tax=Corchorus olitorius TaxID=93759 RepID=A0A1R3H497_9ROSI|nr:Ergosterol biosynthesis ERG4/ERG24 [Corchorus olitorius]